MIKNVINEKIDLDIPIGNEDMSYHNGNSFVLLTLGSDAKNINPNKLKELNTKMRNLQDSNEKIRNNMHRLYSRILKTISHIQGNPNNLNPHELLNMLGYNDHFGKKNNKY